MIYILDNINDDIADYKVTTLYCWNINNWSQNKCCCMWCCWHVDGDSLWQERLHILLDCPHSSLNADGLKSAVVLLLNKFVLEGYVDWDYGNKYTFSGRIHTKNGDSGCNITIYLFKHDEEEFLLEVRRNGGDSFLFHEIIVGN